MVPEASDGEQGKQVEMVPAAPDPEQQQATDVTAHQDYSEEDVAAAATAEINKLLSELQPLRAWISQLLGPAGPHRVVVTGDAGRRCLAFLETELSIFAAFLTPRQLDLIVLLLSNAGLCTDHVLHEVDPLRHTLLRRASRYLHCRNSSDVLHSTVWLYYINEECFRYRHLPTSSNLGLTPQLAEPEPGALPLVGIDRPTKKILRWLSQSQQGTMDRSQLRVMSIVGPVGIGKTTLAMELRNRIRQHETSGGHYYFQCNVMAQASRGADRNILLLQDILSQVSEPAAATALSSDPSSQAKTMKVLVRLVSKCLRDKRYFVIIDDIWEASDWWEIKPAFPRNNLDSRILVTTRSTIIAWVCCSDSYDGLVHEMKPLSELDSKSLFQAKAVGSMGGCLPNNMKLHCDEILRRCDGIPLVIIGMADRLNKQRLQRLHQREHEDKEHHRVAMPYLEQVPGLPERLEQALSSAFNDFPYCGELLLYMGMFPSGYKFEKDRLIWKWIHEGLIHSSVVYWELGKNVLHEAEGNSKAEWFFSQLVDRNVITCVASNCKHKQDEVDACQWQVNHFLQQFLSSKSAEMGFLFTTANLNLLRAALPATGHGSETRSRMPRRLAVHHPDPLLPTLLETMDLSQTRSLAVSGAVSGIPLEKFVNLVVLDLEGWENLKDEDLLQVCRSKMFFLTYLSVRNTRVSKLPHEIKKLQILSTLDVSHTQISKLPLELFQLKYLEHLDLRGTRVNQLPKQIVGLQDKLEFLLVGGEGTINSVETATRLPHDVRHLYLLTLATVDLTRHPASFVRALGDLYRLRVLAVTWSFHQSTDRDYCEALLSSIAKWGNLESLTIHCGLGCSMEFLGSLEKSRAPPGLKKFKVTAGRFARVPPWIHVLWRLAFVQITVYNKQTTTDNLKILGALPKLQCLILGLDFIPSQAIVIGNEGFRVLQRLSLHCVLPWFTFQTGAMPWLEHLRLKFSSGPASEDRVPSGITNLRRIREVVLSYSKWCVNSTSVKMTVKAVKEQVAKQGKPIDLFINSVEDDDVQAVDEEPENATGACSSRTDAGPGRDDAQAVDEEATGEAQTGITEAES